MSKQDSRILDKYNTKKTFHTFVLLLLFSTHLMSSTHIWQTVSIPKVGTFQIPPSMEIQAGKYKEMSDAFQKKILMPFNESSVLVQQKELNDFNKKSFKTYARIIVETEDGKLGDFENISSQIKASAQELQELDTTFKKGTEASFSKINSTGAMTMELISWTPIRIVQINGVSMIKVQYTRSVNNAPAALVNLFVVQNNDRLHRITVSYRQSDANIWKNDLEKVIYTFKFNRR